MVAREPRGLDGGRPAVACLSITVALFLAAPVGAGLVPGGGGKAANDCLVELGVCDGKASTSSPATCTDCDPVCDGDGTRSDVPPPRRPRRLRLGRGAPAAGGASAGGAFGLVSSTLMVALRA